MTPGNSTFNKHPTLTAIAGRAIRRWLRRGSSFLVTALLATTGFGCGMKNRPPAPTAGDPALIALLEPIHREHDLPALAAAVMSSDGLQAQAVVGVRKRGAGTPATLDDLWHLGSNTKAMTATLAGRLVERGKLSWDATPAEVFPELAGDFHPDFRPVTLRQLLAHRAGVAVNLDWEKLARTSDVREQRLAAVKQGLAARPAHPPGSRYLYSNLGYVIAGAMIERVTGRSWEDALRAEIFMPLGMTSAGFGGVGTPGSLDQPWGHLKGGRPVETNGPAADNPPVLGPAGTVHGALADWAKFIGDHLRGLRGQAGLLQAATYRELATATAGGDYGLGWVVTRRDWAGGLALNHCGCNTLFFANVWLVPERDFAVLVVANQGEDAFGATDAAVAAVVRAREAKR
jgi:CubicO group peptidase (beta-lactamase class C family)